MRVARGLVLVAMAVVLAATTATAAAETATAAMAATAAAAPTAGAGTVDVETLAAGAGSGTLWTIDSFVDAAVETWRKASTPPAGWSWLKYRKSSAWRCGHPASRYRAG